MAISGLVLDSNGSPAVSARVVIDGAMRLSDVRTGPDGRFKVSCPRDGRYVVTARKYDSNDFLVDTTAAGVVVKSDGGSQVDVALRFSR